MWIRWVVCCRLYHERWLLFEIPLWKQTNQTSEPHISVCLTQQALSAIMPTLLNYHIRPLRKQSLRVNAGCSHLHLHHLHRTVKTAGRPHWVSVCCKKKWKKYVEQIAQRFVSTCKVKTSCTEEMRCKVKICPTAERKNDSYLSLFSVKGEKKTASVRKAIWWILVTLARHTQSPDIFQAGQVKTSFFIPVPTNGRSIPGWIYVMGKKKLSLSQF